MSFRRIWSGLARSILRTLRMFWKNTAWSWDDAKGNDDGSFLLASDLRRTPDIAPDTDLRPITTTTAIAPNLAKNTSDTSTKLKDKTNDSLTSMFTPNLDLTSTNYSSVLANTTYSGYDSTLDANANNQQAMRIRSSPQQLRVSHISQTLNNKAIISKMRLGLVSLLWFHFGLSLKMTCSNLVWSVVQALTLGWPS